MRRGIKVQHKNCSAPAPLGPHLGATSTSVQGTSVPSLYIPVLFIEHYLFASHKPQSHCCTAKEAFAAANNYRIRLLSRRNRSNLLIKDARPLCPCYTQGFANTAAFIEATELLLYKLSRRGRWLCATTAVAGLFRKSSRSYEMCDKGWVIA